MVQIKSQHELEIMQEGGAILKEAMGRLLQLVRPGITTEYIDQRAEELIKKGGAESSFKKVKNYQWTVCVPINEQVVHTPPSKRILNEGDVLTIDIGAFYKGFHTDHAQSFVVGGTSKDKDSEKIEQFLRIGKETLDAAIRQAAQSTYIGEISQCIEERIYKSGYYIMHELTGHGIGRALHEDPYVPGILDRPVEKTYRIRPGLAIAIEVIYAMGTERIAYEPGSKWSIKSSDNSLTACFEHTVVFFKDGMVQIT